ncbi:DUF6192 family protein [Microbispora sp. CA-102843]|uniref:DUF6192 family protein n=1 Tax=Microbispora sp. CA-102843 TaxID=3239952 RepID=UPI003D8CAC08
MNEIGHVTERRFNDLVDRARDLMKAMTSHQFVIGDMALEIEPMRPAGMGQGEGVYASLRLFADEIGEASETVMKWRWVAHAWPMGQRCEDVSYTVYRVLAPHPDRFELIRQPPLDRRGRRRWTVDAADRAVGRAGNTVSAGTGIVSDDQHTGSADTRVREIRKLASDDVVASAAAAELLSRPDVAGRVMADPNTRRQLYQAQRDHDQQVQDAARERTPAIRHVEHSIHFLDLMSAGHAFVAGIKRLMPQIQADPLTEQEREVTHHVLDQVQAAIDFCRSVINTGDVSMDEQLAKLLNEEEP